MTEYGIQIGGGYDWSTDTLAISVREQREDAMYVAAEPAWEPFAIGRRSKPILSLRPAEAQQLFDLLWREGYRPKDGSGNSGHVAALAYHLEDMRRLVFTGASAMRAQTEDGA